jgi:hypothetical protein
MDYADFIREVLSRPPVVIEYSVSQDLAKAFPDKALLQGEAGYFDVESFARGTLPGDAQSDTLPPRDVVLEAA